MFLLAIFPSFAQAKPLTEVLKSWVGSSITEYSEKNGAPSSSQSIGNGKKAYIFLDTGSTLYFHGLRIERYCRVTLYANNKNIIYHWAWEGNMCE